MICDENIEQVLDSIEQMAAVAASGCRKPLLIGIDGKCASGKSTLAKKLAERMNALLIHADSYFLQPQQRTEFRYRQPGGNFDRERFFTQIIERLHHCQAPILQFFDCREMKLLPEQTVEMPTVVIVEGTYCLHPLLYPWYDLTICIDIDQNTQKERLLRREPADKIPQFFSRWIPYETQYFKQLPIAQKADLLF